MPTGPGNTGVGAMETPRALKRARCTTDCEDTWPHGRLPRPLGWPGPRGKAASSACPSAHGPEDNEENWRHGRLPRPLRGTTPKSAPVARPTASTATRPVGQVSWEVAVPEPVAIPEPAVPPPAARDALAPYGPPEQVAIPAPPARDNAARHAYGPPRDGFPLLQSRAAAFAWLLDQGPSLEEQLTALDVRLHENEEYRWRVRRDARSWATTLGVPVPDRSVLAHTGGLDQLRAAVVSAAATALMQLPIAAASAAAVERATTAVRQLAAAAPARQQLQLALVEQEAPGGGAAPAPMEAPRWCSQHWHPVPRGSQ